MVDEEEDADADEDDVEVEDMLGRVGICRARQRLRSKMGRGRPNFELMDQSLV